MKKNAAQRLSCFVSFRRWSIAFVWLIISFSGHAAVVSIKDQVEELVLDNGMRVLMVHKPGLPSIAAGWVARVGSANEYPGITGMAHLFEHMMFKGTTKIGTKNYQLDFELRQQLDGIREKMFIEERTYRRQVRLGEALSINEPGIQSETMKVLRGEFEATLQKQRENLIKDEFMQTYTAHGATRLNAFTSRDMTVYFVSVPKNKIELWFWMESERLHDPVFREFYSERNVVYEERRLRTESTPTGRHDETFQSLLWRGHPYHWPVVGWPSDISAITRKQAEQFYATYYAPGNITAALVGDFEAETVRQLAVKYFGRLKQAPNLAPDVVTTSTPQLGEVVYRAEVDSQPEAAIHFRTVAFGSQYHAPLELLANVLSGKSGRLYKRLVLNDKIATSVGARANNTKYGGSFVIYARGNSEVRPEGLKAALLEEIDNIKLNGITAKELEKAKNKFSANRYRRLKSPFYLMMQILFVEGLSRWQDFDIYADNFLNVNREQVKEVSNRFFIKDNRASRLYSRKRGASALDPELLAFSSDEQAQIRQMIGQIKKMPASELPSAINSMKINLDSAPQKFKPLYRYVLKVAKQLMNGN